jgi:hypothetical protein
VCKLRIEVDPDDKAIEMTVDEVARKVRVVVERQFGPAHVTEMNLATEDSRKAVA